MVLSVSAAAAVPAQNSTRKVRTPPSEVAARAGEAVRWHDDVAAASAAAEESGKPVFWYVPTVPGSRMDRKPEIDLYMRAGPFSWPGLVALLNEHFEPVRQVPGRELAKEHGLQPVAFIEPGFVVLSPAGASLDRADELTTFHPRWFTDRLLATLPAERREAAAKAARWDLPLAGAKITAEPQTAEEYWWFGAAQYDHQEQEAAHQAWAGLVARFPEHPLAAKAQCEIEGLGPFVRGFEVFLPLPEGVLADFGAARGTTAPQGTYDAEALRRAGLRFFAAMQRADGGFVDSIYDFGGTDSLPNVYAAVTALVGLALLETEAWLGDDAPEREVLAPVRQRALDYVCDEAHLNQQDRDELIWAHLYRTQLLARWMELRPDDVETIRPRLVQAVQSIVGMQGDDGSWYHEYPNPFVSGSCLVALAEAREQGVTVEDRVIERGILALSRCRAENGAVTYSQVREGRNARAQVEGGVGRMPLVEHALAQWERGDPERLATALDLSFEHHDELASVRKYDDHANRYGYGGFFFWYDLLVRTEAIRALPADELRSGLLARQRAQVLALPEIDGCFVDSHELGRVYGTAMALILLARTESR